jgi:large subunit ribosomal protein L13e
LKEYKSKLVLFPRNNKKPKTGEASAEERSKSQQQTGVVFPPHEAKVKPQVAKLSDVPKTKDSVYASLKKQRANARLVGVRAKKAAEKAEKAALESSKKPATE